MESKLRKPLVTQNGSRLQAPSSRLKAPSSFTSKLATATKRSRSPDEAPSAKRQRTVVNENSGTSTATRSTTLRTSNSAGNLNSAASKKLKTNTSGSNLRTGMAQGVGSRTAKTTATVKPSVVKPPKPAPSTRPPATARASNNGRGSNSSSGPPAPTGGRPKRAAWDLKGRLQDMEEEMRVRNGQREDFMSQMLHYNERIASLENTNMQLSGTVAQKEEHAFTANKEKDDLRQKLRNVEDDLDETRRKLERDTENFEFTKASLRRQKDSLESELSAMQQEVTGLKSSVAQLTSSQAGLNSELEATKLALERSTKNEERLQKIVDERDVTIEDFNCKFREHESIRRQLHNLVQELKGNIRVFCRVRPLLGEELLGNDGEIHHMSFPDDDQKSLELERLADVSLSESTIGGARKGNGRYGFSFDRVFGPASSQAEVFDEISQLVQSAMDGYNVCIFAYGQTGSGKTFTMEGPTVVDDESRGMISRAVLQIFTSTKELEDKGWQYEFEASFLEIYNETIRDLLGNHGNDVKHEIKLGTNGNDVSVTNLTTVPVASEDQISDLLKTASKNRAVGETHCNERSSRSHSVFRLKITGSNDITSEQCKGTLNLVDLAGSERLKESGATGQRLKETQNINKSLSNLGNVIMALGNKESHIPYRNSRLTYLLQNSLGGNSKTLMFVNVSPREENFSETLNSLRFATKVNQCNIGTATKKTK